MADGGVDQPNADRERGFRGTSNVDRERLRERLGFPGAVDTSAARDRQRAHGDAVPALEPVIDPEVRRQLQQLTQRINALTVAVETLSDRTASSTQSASASLTTEQLSDVVSRIVRHFEDANTRQATDLEQMRRDIQHLDRALVDVHATMSEHPKRFDRALLDLQATMTALRERSDRALADLQATITQLPLRFDRALAELQATMTALPERSDRALADVQALMAKLPEHFDRTLLDLQATMAELPERVAKQEPVVIDASIVQLLEATLTETSEAMGQKLEEQLASRVQRFEALSQAMMTMVGDPVDALAERLSQLVRAQEAAPNVLQSIAELTQIQGQLASAISALRQDGAERKALLREALDRLDRMTRER